MRTTGLLLLGFVLIILGTTIVVVGSLGSSSNASTGIVVFVGPIPIVFGSGDNGGVLALIALVAAVGMILVFCLPFLVRRQRSGSEERMQEVYGYFSRDSNSVVCISC